MSPKCLPKSSPKYVKVAFRPRDGADPQTCFQGVPPRTEKGAFFMDFGSFFKVFWSFFTAFLATQNECSRIRLQCNATQRDATQCNAMHCNAMHCDVMQCNAMQYTATQRSVCPTLEKTLCRTEFLSHGILTRSLCHTAAAEGPKLSTINSR